MRKILEHLARGRVLKRHLPSAFGRRPIYISPDSALSYLLANWTANSNELLSAAAYYTNQNDNVWDVGANVGVFALAAGHVAGSQGQVIAIEADSFLASLLHRTTAHESNRDLDMHVVCAAAADEVCISRFLIAERGRSSNSLEKSGHRSQAGGIREVQHVPTITLDSLLDFFAPPQLIKIDVEGAEEFVLTGAKQILSKHRPRLYVEVGPDQQHEVSALLRKFDYVLFNGDSPYDGVISQCVFNTLAVPRDSSSEFDERLLAECTGTPLVAVG